MAFSEIFELTHSASKKRLQMCADNKLLSITESTKITFQKWPKTFFHLDNGKDRPLNGLSAKDRI